MTIRSRKQARWTGSVVVGIALSGGLVAASAALEDHRQPMALKQVSTVGHVQTAERQGVARSSSPTFDERMVEVAAKTTQNNKTHQGTSSPAIDINRASAEELTELPGVGEALASRIVEFRKEHGPFRRVEDLMRVRGIGERSFEKMKPLVRVSRDGDDDKSR